MRVEEVEGLLAAEQGRSSTLEEELNALKEQREKASGSTIGT